MQRSEEEGLGLFRKAYEQAAERHDRATCRSLLGELERCSLTTVAGQSWRQHYRGRQYHQEYRYGWAEYAYQQVLRENSEETEIRAATWTALARLYFQQGRFGLAERLYRTSLKEWEVLGDPGSLGPVWIGLGEVARYQCRWEEAQNLYQRGVDLLKGHQPEESVLGWAWLNLGVVARILGDWDQAGALFDRAEEHYQRTHNPFGRALAQMYQGRWYHLRGQKVVGLALLWMAQRELYRLGACYEEGIAWRHLGEAYLSQREHRRAARCFQKSLRQFQRLDDRYHLGIVLSGLGNIYCAWGRFSQAQRYYSRSIRIAEEIGNEHALGWTLNDWGMLCHEQGQLAQARQHYERSLAILERHRSHYKKGEVLIHLARLHYQLDQPDQAWKYLHQAQENAQGYGFQDQREALAALESEFLGYS